MIRDGQFRQAGDSDTGGCVEVAALPEGGIRIRDSKNRDSGLIACSDQTWRLFTTAIKRGEFELPEV
jgi:Domain of unknown function (DUF397)